jgi:hypothetical protein
MGDTCTSGEGAGRAVVDREERILQYLKVLLLGIIAVTLVAMRWFR